MAVILLMFKLVGIGHTTGQFKVAKATSVDHALTTDTPFGLAQICWTCQMYSELQLNPDTRCCVVILFIVVQFELVTIRYRTLKVVALDAFEFQMSIALFWEIFKACNPEGAGQIIGQELVVKVTSADHGLTIIGVVVAQTC